MFIHCYCDFMCVVVKTLRAKNYNTSSATAGQDNQKNVFTCNRVLILCMRGQAIQSFRNHRSSIWVYGNLNYSLTYKLVYFSQTQSTLLFCTYSLPFKHRPPVQTNYVQKLVVVILRATAVVATLLSLIFFNRIQL